MSIHYKFKSAIDYDTITFDGLHISVSDLKKSIVQQKRLGKATDFDLMITNAQTSEGKYCFSQLSDQQQSRKHEQTFCIYSIHGWVIVDPQEYISSCCPCPHCWCYKQEDMVISVDIHWYFLADQPLTRQWFSTGIAENHRWLEHRRPLHLRAYVPVGLPPFSVDLVTFWEKHAIPPPPTHNFLSTFLTKFISKVDITHFLFP